eukprot:9944366-Alexandrium_andersonii.AAC.1
MLCFPSEYALDGGRLDLPARVLCPPYFLMLSPHPPHMPVLLYRPDCPHGRRLGCETSMWPLRMRQV